MVCISPFGFKNSTIQLNNLKMNEWVNQSFNQSTAEYVELHRFIYLGKSSISSRGNTAKSK